MSLRKAGATRRRMCVVRADGGLSPVKAPQGVTQPPQQPAVKPALFGFVDNAEVINSRAAMIGFFGILIVEAIANKGILEMVGFTVGAGLGFEF